MNYSIEKTPSIAQRNPSDNSDRKKLATSFRAKPVVRLLANCAVVCHACSNLTFLRVNWQLLLKLNHHSIQRGRSRILHKNRFRKYQSTNSSCVAPHKRSTNDRRLKIPVQKTFGPPDSLTTTTLHLDNFQHATTNPILDFRNSAPPRRRQSQRARPCAPHALHYRRIATMMKYVVSVTIYGEFLTKCGECATVSYSVKIRTNTTNDQDCVLKANMHVCTSVHDRVDSLTTCLNLFITLCMQSHTILSSIAFLDSPTQDTEKIPRSFSSLNRKTCECICVPNAASTCPQDLGVRNLYYREHRTTLVWTSSLQHGWSWSAQPSCGMRKKSTSDLASIHNGHRIVVDQISLCCDCKNDWIKNF